VKRRKFVSILGAGVSGALAGWPVMGSPAPSDVNRVGVLWDGSRTGQAERFKGVWKELREHGFVEGKNLRVEVLADEGDSSRLQRLASQLVRANVEVIVTEGTQTTRLLQRETQSIPIVTGVGDPVGSGFARSLAKPAGNITGLSWGNAEGSLKRVELMRSFLPRIAHLFIMVDATNRAAWDLTGPLEVASRMFNITPQVVLVKSRVDAEGVFRSQRSDKVGAAFFDGGLPALGAAENQEIGAIAGLAIRSRFALFSLWRVWPDNGGLANSLFYHRGRDRTLASLIARILRGGKPAEIPFVMPDTFESVVNRKTAAALGLEIPQEVLLHATEMIG
jgi:putative ABC transport system substrate-binding protein